MEEFEKKKKQVVEKAIALAYDIDKDQAPKVVAKGRGELAKQILKVAAENGIEIKRNEDLVEILDALEIDEFIPLEAYSAVAEILRFIYSKKK